MLVADLVVFDPDRVADTASFSEPWCYPAGIWRVVRGGGTGGVRG